MKTNAEPTDDEKKEKTFEYRSYGKGELAMLYLPDIQQQSAVDRFNKWIAAAGMNPRSRSYTPAQVRLIVEVLQEP